MPNYFITATSTPVLVRQRIQAEAEAEVLEFTVKLLSIIAAIQQ